MFFSLKKTRKDIEKVFFFIDFFSSLLTFSYTNAEARRRVSISSCKRSSLSSASPAASSIPTSTACIPWAFGGMSISFHGCRVSGRPLGRKCQSKTNGTPPFARASARTGTPWTAHGSWLSGERARCCTRLETVHAAGHGSTSTRSINRNIPQAERNAWRAPSSLPCPLPDCPRWTAAPAVCRGPTSSPVLHLDQWRNCEREGFDGFVNTEEWSELKVICSLVFFCNLELPVGGWRRKKEGRDCGAVFSFVVWVVPSHNLGRRTKNALLWLCPGCLRVYDDRMPNRRLWEQGCIFVRSLTRNISPRGESLVKKSVFNFFSFFWSQNFHQKPPG